MTPWADLEAELDAWASRGRSATFWWRDDDAVAPTAELVRLLDLARTVPLALAVIPTKATPALAQLVTSRAGVAVLQHGYAHRNHAGPGEKKAEFGPGRALPRMLEDIGRGRRRLAAMFGDRFLPVLVPPWNRVVPEIVAELRAVGIEGISTYGARQREPARRSVAQVNTHVDIVAWRGDRGFIGEAAALGLAVAHLRRRRVGDADAAEPTGLLTHHLVMDAPAWRFVEEFVGRVTAHPAASFLAAPEAFGLRGANHACRGAA